MNALIALVALVATPMPEADRLADVIVKAGCYANHKPDRAMVVQLLKIEDAAGFEGPARGLLVAAACNESGFNPKALGDWHDVVTGKRCKNRTPGCVPRSFGLLQFQAWAKRKIRPLTQAKGDPRFDWRASAIYWAKHVVAQVPRVQRECRYTSAVDTWMAAHRTAITAPKCGRLRYSTRLGRQVCVQWIPRCHRLGGKRSSKHWEIAQHWQTLADRKFPRPVVQN